MHFTYNAAPDPTSLYQGDLIVRNEAIDTILEQVHPHYQKQDYKAFIVLTQSCDLVRRRGNQCSARYISLAAVRPLDLVLTRQFDSLARNKWESEFRLSNRKNREKMRLFVERLFNNNEDEYFFLFREPEAGFPEDSCAFLQLSIAVKSEYHYATLLAAKRLQLSETFQHKLGYLVGKMYSRVGTPDWVPAFYPEEKQFQQHINELIDTDDFATWIDDDAYKNLEMRSASEPGVAVTKEKLVIWAEEFAAAKAKRRRDFLATVEGSFTDAGVTAGLIRRGIARLESSPMFKTLFRSTPE